MYTVSVSDSDTFRDRRGEWNALARRMHFPSIFCTWEWIYTWWEHFGASYDPVILFVHRGSDLTGIVPLALKKPAAGDWLGVRTLVYCGSHELYPDHLDIICDPREAEACLRAVFTFLSHEYTDWEVLRLPAIAEDSAIATWLAGQASPWRHELRRMSSARYVPLTGTFEEYVNSFDKKQRYNLRSRRKKLLEQHGMQYIVCDPSRYTEGLDILFNLHELRAQRKQIVSTFQGSRLSEYHNALVRRLDPSAVWLRWLECDGKPIAAAYNFMFEGCIFSYQKGFDPVWERFGPGMVMVYEAIQEAFARGYREYNFLRGGEEYKDTWTPHSRALFHCNIYNTTIRGGLTMASARSIGSVKRCLKKLAGHGA